MDRFTNLQCNFVRYRLESLTAVERELFIGSLNFWAMFGALGAHYFSDKWGRRRAFVVAAIGFIIGIGITVLAQNYTTLMVGRLLVGLGVGVGLAIDPLYIAEVTPAKYRGELVTWSEIATNVGIIFGFSTGLFMGGLDDGVAWRIMFLMGCIMPTLMIVMVATVMPESPRWLVANNREDDALEILSRIYPPGYDTTPILYDMQEAIARDTAAENAVGWTVVFRPTSAFRRMLMVGVGTAIAHQAVGIDAIQYYLLDIIEDSGIESDKMQNWVLVFLGIIKLVFIVVGGKCFDRFGRRPLFFVSLLGMYFSLAMVGVSKLMPPSVSTWTEITSLAFYLATFSIGMGPGGWLIPSEVFSVSIRAKAMSVATTMNRAVATIMSSTFLSIAEAMGFGAFCSLLAIICAAVLAFLYAYLPETKGHTLEDMSIYFAEITGDRSILEAEAELMHQWAETQSKRGEQEEEEEEAGAMLHQNERNVQ